MTYEADPKHVAPLAQAMSDYDTAVKALIRLELEATVRPELEAAEVAAAERLRAALANLEPAEACIADLDSQISAVQARAAEWNAEIEIGTDWERRIDARKSLAACDEEIADLNAKRDEMAEAMAPHIGERNKARDALIAAQHDLGLYDTNLHTPFLYRGQETSAYRSFRVGMGFGSLVPILLAHRADHFEWEAAIAFLEILCIASGYRTDKLPNDDMKAAAVWDELLADSYRDAPAPVPSGADAMAILRMHAESETAVSHDYSPPRPRPGTNGPSEANRADGWRQVQRLNGGIR